MKFVKIGLRDAEKLKGFLRKNRFFEENVRYEKEGNSILFPVKESAIESIRKIFPSSQMVELKKEKSVQPTTLKEALAKSLSENELQLVKTSFDVVGDIAIIEIPEELKKKEKVIGEAVLASHKSIKVVCKKVGIHHGEFRTQDLKVIAGEKRKETEYIENGVKLKLDVEKVYFSPRLSTERKRINALVKEGEDVLIMFSGCGPYVFSIAKNTKAMDVYGIEINPTAHSYALINKELNRAHNAVILCGDAKKLVPDIYKHIIGLKSSYLDNELKSRVEKKPKIMEFHLYDDNLEKKNMLKLEKKVAQMKKKGMDVFAHMPRKINGRYVNISTRNCIDDIKMLTNFGRFCKKNSIGGIVHINIGSAEEGCERDAIIHNLRQLKDYFRWLYFENDIEGLFHDARNIIEIGKEAGIKNVCIDICHMFLMHKNNKKIIEDIMKLKREFNTYFHLSDSDGQSHGVEIGKGKVDFERILPLVNIGVTEVISKDEINAKEMIRSYDYVCRQKKLFDRILMPLPKGAHDFLDTAIHAAKKGAVIHFYDFLFEDDFPKRSIEKIEKACKKAKRKFKILNSVKCGQYSPRKFRVCIDFKVM